MAQQFVFNVRMHLNYDILANVAKKNLIFYLWKQVSLFQNG